MRDRLQMLQTISEEQDYDPELSGPEWDADGVSLSQEAVVFENCSVTENILKEAYSMRKEISLLRLEVERLNRHNERFGTSVRRLTLLKHDSDTIARRIHQRGEALYARLEALGTQSRQLEEKEGLNSAVCRIARVQHDTLTREFHAVMSDYNMAEEMQKTTCRGRLQRQASILGTDITDDQLDVLVDKGGEGWTVLSESLHTQEGRTSRWALCEIKSRHKELVELEARMKEIHELFLNMAMLVEEQGSMLNNIEANVCGTQEYIDKINVHIKKALQYKRKNPFRQCCPCLPCWRRVL
ncbi:syntaxin-11-like [Myripristis murdjan]|uniref:Syntaxin 11 n=1 Tax=Myripristis murdjan TaxID=586833 RepID=A0A667YN41_9TELE|nr:syntaxin-11-like [Myripristis murdjan]XP_029903352.1 syntaxin-11-like [Myripristis murdjan]